MEILSYAALEAGGELVPFKYKSKPLSAEEVQIAVLYCGVCHSDISMIENEWGISSYPLIAGHEVVGRITSMGEAAKNKGLAIGQLVGIGWNAKSCQHCDYCINGQHVNCENRCTPTILNNGGFASHVSADWQWIIPLSESVDPSKIGPLLCAGITVFKPLLKYNITALSRVGVIGIGGLGHIAIKILRAMGADVTAFSSNPAKFDSIMQLGADHVVNSRDIQALNKAVGQFDLIINTVSADLDWEPYYRALAPEGAFHTVGVTMKPFAVPAARLISGDHSISGSSTGSPTQLRSLMKLALRAQIEPMTEEFPMSRVNEAIARVKSGKANFRVVLKADF